MRNLVGLLHKTGQGKKKSKRKVHKKIKPRNVQKVEKSTPATVRDQKYQPGGEQD